MKKKDNKKPTIAILTGGGDVPGLNPCIKTLVYRAGNERIKVLGIRRGWAGLLEYHWTISPPDLCRRQIKGKCIVILSWVIDSL